MTERNFNLIEHGWIQVQGEKQLQSLRQIFSNPQFARLAGNPVEKIVVLRLLLAITQAAVPLPDTQAWLNLSLKTLAEKALDYLDCWHESFDLYGPRPFMQFPQLASGKAVSFSAAQPYVATGNKTVLNSWNIPIATKPAEQAMALLKQSSLASGGKKFDPQIVLSANMGEKKASGSPGTLVGFLGHLHTYLLGENILDTIKNNLLTDSDIQGLPFTSKGRPCWEEMPDGEISERAIEYRDSYLGQLMPLDKFVLLRDNDMVMTEGIPYNTYTTGLFDPALTIYQDKKAFKTVWARTEIRPWRELTALLSFLQTDATNKSPHFLSLGIEKLKGIKTSHMRFWAGGVQLSSNAGEQYISGMNDYVESEFHLPITVLSMEKGFDIFQKLIKDLEHYAKITYASVSSYFNDLSNEQKNEHAASASGHFWETMEPRAQEIINLAFVKSVDQDKSINNEMKLWQTEVMHTYNLFCPKDTARQMTAWVKATPNFHGPKKKGK